ncbi:hypothetical protein BU23DRAFT_583180 [Bimuria novae-zelandiae CBS 107.79]|uniref:RTA1 domain protein n=1 Tax=Bimuria novae-zelandiae CBS 107.79 TaxID=1447943 RepID=A0A6A5UWW9_9PLEO|nr:hypothetical protein BU23DRAFT_583180 [Bimuria novae-zelandiae CBS 107.79]
MGAGDPIFFSLYIYAPNKIGAIVVCVLYALSAAARIYQCRAFDAYIYSKFDLSVLLVYILSQVSIYICPPLLELSNYHLLGHLLRYIPHLSPLRPALVLRIFGSLMLIVETLNALGVSLSANPSGKKMTQNLGKGLTLAALVAQILVIFSVVVLATMFHRRVNASGMRVPSVIRTTWTLHGSMALIFVRCIYRLVEHLGNTEIELDDMEALKAFSPILRYEWFFYVFEAVLMFVNMVLWNIWNPGAVLARNVYLSRDGATEINYEEAGGWSYCLMRALLMAFGSLGSGAMFAFLWRPSQNFVILSNPDPSFGSSWSNYFDDCFASDSLEVEPAICVNYARVNG